MVELNVEAKTVVHGAVVGAVIGGHIPEGWDVGAHGVAEPRISVVVVGVDEDGKMVGEPKELRLSGAEAATFRAEHEAAIAAFRGVLEARFADAIAAAFGAA